MSSFDYLKTAIKQQGCTLQQVADASGMTKGYLSQLLNAKIKAPARKSWRRCTVFWGLNFPDRRKPLVSYSVSSTRCIPDISTLSSAPVARLMSYISLWALTIPVTVRCLKTAPCRSSPRCRIVCAGYCKPLNIRKYPYSCFQRRGHGAVSARLGCVEQWHQKVYG